MPAPSPASRPGPSTAGRSATRRRLIGAGLATAGSGLLAGCRTWEDVVDGGTRSGAASPAAERADRRLLATLRAEAGTRAAAASGAVPGGGLTAASLSALTALHAAQLDALGQRVTPSATSSTTAAGAPGAPRAGGAAAAPVSAGALRDGEIRWRATLLAAVPRAEDGALAALLASLAAGQSERLALLGWGGTVRPAAIGTASRSDREPAWVEALQTALAAEHGALYLDGVLGARSEPGSAQRTRLQADLERHQDRRDALTALLLSLGARPVGPAAAYALPTTRSDAAALAAAAAQVELATVGPALGVVAAAPAERRASEASAAVVAAVAGVGWGGEPSARPGLLAR